VVRIPNGVVIAPVGLGIDHTKTGNWSGKVPVKGLIDIYLIKRIYIPDMIIVIPKAIVEDTHTTQAVQLPVSVIHVNISDSVDPSIIIVKDRKLRYLNYRTEVVILNIGIVVET
jgi:hypothetical protein